MVFYVRFQTKCQLKFKDKLKAFNNFKNKQSLCMKHCFLIYKSIYFLEVYAIHYALR